MDEYLQQNPGLTRRVPYRFEFKPYTKDELFQILKLYCKYGAKLELPEEEAKKVKGRGRISQAAILIYILHL